MNSCPELLFSVDVRLVRLSAVGGNAGRVEVYSDYGYGSATWARLCDREWNRNIARVVCQQLGFDDVDIFYHYFRKSPFGRGRQTSIIRVQMCHMPNAGKPYIIYIADIV